MTTIIYKDGIMYSDSRGYSGDKSPIGSKAKMHQLKNGAILGVSSSKVGEAERFKRLVEKDLECLEAQDEIKVQALLVLKDGSVYYFNDEKSFSGPLVADWFAIGSGEQFAVGALSAGASAKKAMRITIELDHWSGGEVNKLALSK